MLPVAIAGAPSVPWTPTQVAGSLHRGHFTNKPVDKAPLDVHAAGVTAVHAWPSAAHMARQALYLEKAAALEPTMGDLPPVEREARRASLKRSVLEQ